MASIIHEMLRMAHIKSYLTWIGSRDIPYTYSEVPTPATDNHMITTYLDKNKHWVFLDGTGKDAPINTFTSFIQGKQAMIGLTNDSFALATLPVPDTSANTTIDSSHVSIQDKLVIGKGKITMKG